MASILHFTSRMKTFEIVEGEAYAPYIAALEVTLTAGDLQRLDTIAPKGVAAGERYGEAMMNFMKKST